MAFGASTWWEVQTGGSDSNGGGFDPNNANFAADLTTDTNTGNTASPVVSSASYNFVAGDVGHWVFIQSGTNWIPGWYQIASVASNKATLSAAAGAGVAWTANMPKGDLAAPTSVAGVASVGTPTSGTWGIDYSQNTSPFSFTDMVIDGTTNTKFTSAGHPVGVNFVGNVINVTSGTGFTVQRVQVVSVSGTVATCDKSLGTLSSTGGNGTFGGPLLTVSKANSLLVAGNRIWIKSGTYTVTATTTVTIASTFTAGPVTFQGYQNLRSDNTGTKPLLTTATNSTPQFTLTGCDLVVFRNLKITNTAATRAEAFLCATTGPGAVFILECVIDGCSYAFNGASRDATQLMWIGSTILNGTTGGVVNGGLLWVIGCEFRSNAGSGIENNSLSVSHISVQGCLFASNGRGVYLTGSARIINYSIRNCTFYNHTNDGIRTDQTTGTAYGMIENCIFDSNGAYGINMQASRAQADSMTVCRFNAYRSNSSGAQNNLTAGFGDITLSGSPFTNAGGNDFSLNNTAGAGASCRAAGWPGAYPGSVSVGYQDLGAVQHQDSGGGGGVNRALLPAGLGGLG